MTLTSLYPTTWRTHRDLPHEVIKRVGERAYRYQVERYRDPATGKVRGRWTYLGRVGADGNANPARRRPSDSRDRLIAALERLLDRRSFGDVTAGQVAEEAGLAHGTFYRYFRDKGDALRAAIEQVREALDWKALLADRPVSTRAAERRHVARWADSILRAPIERLGLARAWFAAMESDPAVARSREERRERALTELSAYLVRLDRAGIASVPHPRGTAAALFALIDATTRAGIASGGVDDEQIEGTLSVVERAIFGR